MAQSIPKVTISIQNYNKAVIYLNLTINQSIGAHHYFSFIWNVGEVKSNENFQLDLIRNNIGKTVNINIEDTLFKGVITQITVQNQNSNTQSFRVTGQSLTVLLDDAPKSASYYKKNLKKIVDTTLESVPSNVLPNEVKPSNTQEQVYITQYNETDFQFLQRLASRFGQWFYSDGITLNFGRVQHSGLKLKNVADVNNFIVSASLQPTQFSYKAYDYHQAEIIDKESGKLDSDVKNDYSIASADSSNELFNRKDERSMHNFNTINKKMVEDMSQLEHDRIDAQLVSISGDTKHHGLKIGYTFDVETINGNYDIIPVSITHFSSVVGHYQNAFIAVPATSKVPPYTNPHTFRKAEAQSAKVIENYDKDGLNRVKVHFPWQRQNDNTPWIRVAAPHAGASKGFHFIPEKDEEVVVDFEGSDVDKPYVTSTIFNNKAKSGQGDADNNIKSITTRSGNTIRLNDKEGSITITDAKGSTIILKGDETIEITSKKKITIASKDIELKAENNITLNAKSNINLNANGNLSASAGGSITAKATKGVSVKSSTDKIDVEGLQDVSVKSGAGAVNIEAMTEFKAKGTAGATVEGLKLDLKGTAMASLQATLVKIN